MSGVEAALSPCGRWVTMRGPSGWSEQFAVADLAAKVRFYQGLRDRRGGRYARHYDGTLAALRAVLAQVRESSRDQGGSDAA